MIYNKLPIDLQNKILSYYGESLKYKNPGLLYQIENLIWYNQTMFIHKIVALLNNINNDLYIQNKSLLIIDRKIQDLIYIFRLLNTYQSYYYELNNDAGWQLCITITIDRLMNEIKDYIQYKKKQTHHYTTRLNRDKLCYIEILELLHKRFIIVTNYTKELYMNINNYPIIV
tara:strand:+ start:6743 stop:7258 length:516 start_codon:yes stop_codon:yes gene_type:complete